MGFPLTCGGGEEVVDVEFFENSLVYAVGAAAITLDSELDMTIMAPLFKELD